MGKTRYLAGQPTRPLRPLSRREGRSWGGSTERNTYGRRTQGSESGGRSVSGGGVAMRGTFVAIGTVPNATSICAKHFRRGSTGPGSVAVEPPSSLLAERALRDQRLHPRRHGGADQSADR